MSQITYISFYSCPDDPQQRRRVPACANKMDSIIDTLTKLGYNVEVVSACGSDKRKVCPGRLDRISAQVTLQFFVSFPWTNPISKVLCMACIYGGILVRLLRMRKDDKVIVYHSLAYMKIIEITHKIRRFQLILEVEEIYSDVTGNNRKRERERAFFKVADKYIFPTKILENFVNTDKKPAAIINGTYKVEPDRHCNVFHNDVNMSVKRKIHCVYAGTLDPRKGGAIAAASAAEYLPDNYYIHILGFGNEEEVQKLKEYINYVQSRSMATVSYDGVRSGEEYIRFIQSCDIGLSTQDPSGAFNDTSFPSKILSYLANGLRVVSVRIPAVETSDVGELLHYYDIQTPEEIARAILSVNVDKKSNCRDTIEAISKKFELDLNDLLEEPCSS